MNPWCNVCQARKDKTTTDYRGNTACPDCGTRLRAPTA